MKVVSWPRWSPALLSIGAIGFGLCVFYVVVPVRFRPPGPPQLHVDGLPRENIPAAEAAHGDSRAPAELDRYGFRREPPEDQLRRLTPYGLPESGPRRLIVDTDRYSQPAQKYRKSWDVEPPADDVSYTGPADSMKTHAFDEKASNAVASGRSIPDSREPSCKLVQYDDELPTTSVIICFHNEARSTLLRTVRRRIGPKKKESSG